MVITIVWITATKTTDINATIVNVIQKLNSPARRTSNGADPSVFQRNGFATEIQIVLTVLTKILHFTAVQHHSHAQMINLHAATEDVSTKDGFVTSK